MGVPKHVNRYEHEMFELFADTSMKTIQCETKGKATSLRMRMHGFRAALARDCEDNPAKAVRLGWHETLQVAVQMECLLREQGGKWCIVVRPRQKITWEAQEVDYEVTGGLKQIVKAREEVEQLQKEWEEQRAKGEIKTPEEVAKNTQDELFAMLGYQPGKRSVEDKRPENSAPESPEIISTARPSARCKACTNLYFTDMPKNFNFGEYCSLKCQEEGQKDHLDF